MTAIDYASQHAWTILQEQAEQRAIVATVVLAASKQCKYPIMPMLLLGYREKDIAEQLHISDRWVRHYKRIFRDSLHSLLLSS